MSTKGYKGFDSQLQDKAFQYEIGQEYAQSEYLVSGMSGLYFYEDPIDLFEHFPPAISRYCSVLSTGIEYRFIESSFVSTSQLTLTEEVELLDLIKESAKFLLDRVYWGDRRLPADGFRCVSSGVFEWSAAYNPGDLSVSAHTSGYSVASNKGELSAAVTTGTKSVAVSKGKRSVAVNTGCWSVASNGGSTSVAANTGDQSATVNTGDRSMSFCSGLRSAAVNAGKGSIAACLGDLSAAVTTGAQSVAVNIGARSAAIASNDESVAMAIGHESKAKGSKGCWLVLGERDGRGDLLDVQCRKVDGVVIKEDTFYMLVDGEFVEVE